MYLIHKTKYCNSHLKKNSSLKEQRATIAYQWQLSPFFSQYYSVNRKWHFPRISGCKMNRQHVEKLTVVSNVHLFFWELECFSYNITASMWHNIHTNNDGICFLEVTKQIKHMYEKMCYLKLTTSKNESLNSHCTNINLSDELHFQYWQDVKISQPSTMHMQVDLQTTGFLHLTIQFLQLCVYSEIKVCT